MTQAPSVDVHLPKVEYFNITDLTNTDPKGFVRPVERYRAEPWGLYMARTSDHPQFHYIESWLLPELFIRATVFHYLPAHRRDQDYYLDVGEYSVVGPKKWKSVDHYLDIVVRSSRETELLDVDELLAAYTAGMITLTEAEAAVQHATAAIDGIAANGHTFEGWIESLGITLTWM
jgi:predicted RNA-binding protein associated with RNAse of E/G family